MVKEKQEDSVGKVSEKSSVPKSLLKNYWAIAAIVLGLLLMVSFFFSGGCPSVSGEKASQNVLTFLEAWGEEARIVNVEEYDNSFYEVMLSVDGQVFPVYVTKDGENLVLDVVPLTGFAVQEPVQQTPPAQASLYSDEELLELKEFNDCLGENGMVIYGAHWCGFCKQLADLLGGYDLMGSVYIECTENESLCASEGITGYPTIKVNGEPYAGARSLDAFAQVTGCPIPSFV